MFYFFPNNCNNNYNNYTKRYFWWMLVCDYTRRCVFNSVYFVYRRAYSKKRNKQNVNFSRIAVAYYAKGARVRIRQLTHTLSLLCLLELRSTQAGRRNKFLNKKQKV